MRKHWKLTLVITVVLLAAFGIWISMIGSGPEKEVEAYKKSLIAKGEKLEISELLPPTVPPEQNGADIVSKAFGLLTPQNEELLQPSSMNLIAPGKAIVSFEQPDVRNPYQTNSWDEVRSEVEANRSATELLKQAMNYPVLDFQVTYTNWVGVDLGYLGSFEGCSERLTVEAICDLRAGDAASATTSLCALLALVNGQQDARALFSQETRMDLAQAAAETSWELLQSSNVDDVDLARLQKSWERLEFIHALRSAFLMDRACDKLTIEQMQASDEIFDRMWGVEPEPAPSIPPRPGVPPPARTLGDDWDVFWFHARDAGSKALWHATWSYSDELQMLQNEQLILETLRTIETNHVFEPAYTNMMDPLNSELTQPEDWRTKMDERGMRQYYSRASASEGNQVGRAMATEAGRQMVVAAIALKRYQLKHGNYPANLNSLVPEFVSGVPLDPVDGKPLRYRLKKDGTFLLYSIGPDGKDDGGDPSSGTSASPVPAPPPDSISDWLDMDSLDWVWPQPATAAEIEYYFEHSPR